MQDNVLKLNRRGRHHMLQKKKGPCQSPSLQAKAKIEIEITITIKVKTKIKIKTSQASSNHVEKTQWKKKTQYPGLWVAPTHLPPNEMRSLRLHRDAMLPRST